MPKFIHAAAKSGLEDKQGKERLSSQNAGAHFHAMSVIMKQRLLYLYSQRQQLLCFLELIPFF